MRTARILPAIAALFAAAAFADDTPPHRLGDHPAVVVQRLQRGAGYDYASRFYPHPAWLYLRAGPSPAPATPVRAPKPARPRGRPPG